MSAESERRVQIAGLGRYLPPRVVENAELEARFGLTPGWILAHNGVAERRSADVAAGETATWMAARAAREALDEAGLAPEDLDLILNASGTAEQAIPDGAPLVQRHLGLGGSGIPAFSVHATCLSFLVALDTAAALIACGRHQNVLVVSADVGSASVIGRDPESETLWGDAAAAAVLVPTPMGSASALHRTRMHTHGDRVDLTQVRGGGTRLHPARPGLSADLLRDELRFEMRGPEVLRHSLRIARPFFADLLPDGPSALDVIVPHQPSLAGLEALAALGLPRDRTVSTLQQLGNCVAASLPCTLYAAHRTGALRRGHRLLLFGTGAGLSMAGSVWTF